MSSRACPITLPSDENPGVIPGSRPRLTAALLTRTLAGSVPPRPLRRLGRQLSPGKDMISLCTTAAFTSPHVLRTGFGMLCSLAQGFGLLCDFCSSARRFALGLLSDIGSPLCPCRRLVLFEVVTMTSSRNMYRGLAPHKIMPMPGTHKRFRSWLASLSRSNLIR